MFKAIFSNIYLAMLGFSLILSVSATTATAQGCSQPSNLNSNVLTGGTVELTWSAVGGAASYVVQYRVGNSGVWLNGGTVTTNTRVLTGLLPETVYTWRVRASCSTFSSVATFNSGGGVGGNTACSQPSNLDAFVTSTTSVSLSWSAIEGALFYNVQYRVASTLAWVNAGSLSGTQLNVGGLLENAQYEWRVKASCSVYSSVASFNTGSGGGGGNTECSQPSNQEAFALSNNSVQLSWSGVLEALNYTVRYRVGLTGAWVTLGPVTGTTVTVSGLAQNTTYYWQVKASCSVYSSEAIFTTGGTSGGGSGGGGSTSCSAPSNTNTNAVFPTSAQVSWEPQGGALDYTLQYRLELGRTYTTVGTFTSSSATITGLQPGVQYVWRVKANCSPYGSDNQFSTPVFRMSRGNASGGVAVGEMQLWPNPAASVVDIRVAETGAQLFLVNSVGQVVFQEVLTDLQNTINVANLNNGVYFARVQYNNGQAKTTRLVVAH